MINFQKGLLLVTQRINLQSQMIFLLHENNQLKSKRKKRKRTMMMVVHHNMSMMHLLSFHCWFNSIHVHVLALCLLAQHRDSQSTCHCAVCRGDKTPPAGRHDGSSILQCPGAHVHLFLREVAQFPHQCIIIMFPVWDCGLVWPMNCCVLLIPCSMLWWVGDITTCIFRRHK